MLMSKDELIKFEDDIANCFNNGMIKAPVHLYSNNEDQIIKIFEAVRMHDWVCCTWRSHYQCLLKGVPPQQVKDEILKGHSISLCFPEYRVISSAIVGGIIPIALGLAKASRGENVWCFVGDMTAQTGTFAECNHYAVAHNLPIIFVIEDNGHSVCTDTKEVWNNCLGYNYEKHMSDDTDVIYDRNSKIMYYKYTNKYPHAGAGKRVQF